MIGGIVTLILGILKWVVEKKMKKRLNDRQFVDFIVAHQKRRIGAGKTAQDFEDALEETLNKMDEDEKSNR